MGELLSVLIVDDELPIRQELKMFDWEQWGTVLIGEAENGVEALQMCREYTPDIVITDITMPRMDGLTLFRKLKEEFPCTQVIILTCHSDFDYAREALKLGAIDYITKVMVEEEELARALKKARKEIDRELYHLKGAEEALRYEQARIIRKILYGKDNNDKIIELLNELKKQGLNINFPLRLVNLSILVDSQDWLFIRQEISSFLSNYRTDLQWVLTGIGQYLLFFDKKKDHQEYLETKLNEVLQYLKEKIDNQLSFIQNEIYTYGVIGNIIKQPVDFKENYKKIQKWRNMSFYDDETSIYFGIPWVVESLSRKEIKQVESKMREVYLKKEKLIEFIKNNFTNWAIDRLPPLPELKNLVLEWRGEWYRKLRFGGYIEDFSKQITQARTLSEMISIIMLDLNAEKNERHYRPEVRKARNIVLEKYNEPITLSSIAEEVGLCSNYLSRLFTEEVGESFNDMITRLRLEKACDLLKNTNLKIYEVAEEVGISSYRYFSVLFKNNIGVTPSQYRKG